MIKNLDLTTKIAAIAAGLLVAILLIFTVASGIGEISSNVAKPTFAYDTTGLNGEIETVCSGDSKINVRVVGRSDGFFGDADDRSLSLVFFQATNLESGGTVKGEQKTSVSKPSQPADFDFVNTVQLERPLQAGKYTYQHYFYSINTIQGATPLRGFETEFTVKDC